MLGLARVSDIGRYDRQLSDDTEYTSTITVIIGDLEGEYWYSGLFRRAKHRPDCLADYPPDPQSLYFSFGFLVRLWPV
jgi:hypothetical protein